MQAEPRVSFIVVNYNGGDMLADCMASIEAQSLTDYELLVVDNGSSDGSVEGFRTDNPRVRLLPFDENLGFAEGNNRALSQVRGRYVALINNDVTLAPDWAELMVRALEADAGLGAAACRVVQMNDPTRLDCAGFEFYSCVSAFDWRGLPADSMSDGEHQPFGPVAAAAMYRRSALDEVGHFHQEYFCYYEDTDLAVRLVLFSYRTVYVDAAVAHHVGSATGQRRSDFHIYHLRRNSEFVYWVDMVGPLAWIHLPFHLLHEAGALASATLEGRGNVVLRAKLDALKKLPFIVRERRRLGHALARRAGRGAAWRELGRRMKTGVPWRPSDPLVRR